MPLEERHRLVERLRYLTYLSGQPILADLAKVEAEGKRITSKLQYDDSCRQHYKAS
jgi:hypothetical protein